jgi:CubicO group peptidase (beta-lactamase class C family)
MNILIRTSFSWEGKMPKHFRILLSTLVLGTLLLSACLPSFIKLPQSQGKATQAAKATAAASTPIPALQPADVSEAVLGDFNSILTDAVAAYKVPGGAVAVVKDGQVVFSSAFGLRSIKTKKAFTDDTVFRIGAASESFTSMLVAAQVDEGLFTWDTPVVKIYPDFKLGDSALTESVTVRQLLDMSTGLGANPIQLYADQWTGKTLFAGLADLAAVQNAGKSSFTYNPQLFASAGYLGLLSKGAGLADLEKGFADDIKQRLLDPIGLKHTAVCDDPAKVSSNYAVSYGYFLPKGALQLREMAKAQVHAGAPAFGICSTLNDMASYLIAQLNDGALSDGAKVASALNLAETKKALVKVDDNTSYGMGWMVGRLLGVPALYRSGSMDSFKIEMVLIPQDKLGILVVANSEPGQYFTAAVRDDLLRKMYKISPPSADPNLAAFQAHDIQLNTLAASVKSFTLGKSTVSAYLGKYDLGWTVKFHDNMLWMARPAGNELVLVPTETGYVIGTGNELNGLLMEVAFTKDAGKTWLTITKNGAVINKLSKK